MKYFGTDGFRGEANVGLTVEHAYKIGRFVGWYYGANRERKARVIVGKDTRRSSYMFEAALVSGLVASGADAYMLHVIPTPGVAHQTVEGCFDCGIMISASHNPFCDNGIKLVNSDGFKMDEDVLELIEDYIDGKSEVPLATGNHIGATVDYMPVSYTHLIFALSVHNSKKSFYTDVPPLYLDDGTWVIKYSVQAPGTVGFRDQNYNRKMLNCMECGVPVGVIFATEVGYKVLGLAFVERFEPENGWFVLHGPVHKGGPDPRFAPCLLYTSSAVCDGRPQRCVRRHGLHRLRSSY